MPSGHRGVRASRPAVTSSFPPATRSSVTSPRPSPARSSSSADQQLLVSVQSGAHAGVGPHAFPPQQLKVQLVGVPTGQASVSQALLPIHSASQIPDGPHCTPPFWHALVFSHRPWQSVDVLHLIP